MSLVWGWVTGLGLFGVGPQIGSYSGFGGGSLRVWCWVAVWVIIWVWCWVQDWVILGVWCWVSVEGCCWVAVWRFCGWSWVGNWCWGHRSGFVIGSQFGDFFLLGHSSGLGVGSQSWGLALGDSVRVWCWVTDWGFGVR